MWMRVRMEAHAFAYVYACAYAQHMRLHMRDIATSCNKRLRCHAPYWLSIVCKTWSAEYYRLYRKDGPVERWSDDVTYLQPYANTIQ